MATYNSNRITASGGITSRPVSMPSHGLGGNLKAYYFELTTTAAAVTTDTLNLGHVPKGFRFLFATLAATDMDSGTTLTWDLGDSGDTDRLVASATAGQTNTFTTTARPPAANLGHGYVYTADTLLQITVTANATAAGTFYVTVFGTIEGAAS